MLPTTECQEHRNFMPLGLFPVKEESFFVYEKNNYATAVKVPESIKKTSSGLKSQLNFKHICLI